MGFILATFATIATFSSSTLLPFMQFSSVGVERPGNSESNPGERGAQLALAETSNQKCSIDVLPYASLRQLNTSMRSLHIEGTNGGSLYYLGVIHTSDVQHPQFIQLEQDFDRIQPTIVFYEGPDRSLPGNRTDAIQEAGEPGFIRYLATQQNIPIAQLEPPRQAEIDLLIEQFTPEQVKLFYVLRQVAELRDVWHTRSKAQLQEAVAQSITQLSSFDGLKTTVTNIDDFEASYQNHWQTSTPWWNVPRQWFHPVLTVEETGGVFTNDIHRTASTFRNQHMVQVLADAVNQGHRVMAVVGKGHLPLQAPALQCRIQ